MSLLAAALAKSMPSAGGGTALAAAVRGALAAAPNRLNE